MTINWGLQMYQLRLMNVAVLFEVNNLVAAIQMTMEQHIINYSKSLKQLLNYSDFYLTKISFAQDYCLLFKLKLEIFLFVMVSIPQAGYENSLLLVIYCYY